MTEPNGLRTVGDGPATPAPGNPSLGNHGKNSIRRRSPSTKGKRGAIHTKPGPEIGTIRAVEGFSWLNI